MAHYAKYGRAGCESMIAHYRRERDATLERENIDRERTHLNYVLGPNLGRDEIASRMERVKEETGRAVPANSAAMCDWIVTAPPDLRQEDQRTFFEETYRFVAERYGEENMLGGWVHMDETTPHIHIAFTPMYRRDSDNRLCYSANQLVNRSDLNRFHQDLSDRLSERLGYRCQVLTQDPIGRALSRLDGLDEYKRAKDEIRETSDRLERLRQDERRAGERNQELGRKAEELQREVREAEDRERQIEEAHRQREAQAQRLQREVPRAEEECRRLGEENKTLEAEHKRLEGIRKGLRERVRGLRERIEALKERIREHLPHQRQEEPQKAPERPECVTALQRGFERAEELRLRSEALNFEADRAYRELGPTNYMRLLEIDKMIGNDVSELNFRIGRQERETKRTEEKLERLQARPLRNRSEIRETQAKLGEYREKLAELNREKNSLEEERERLQDEDRRRDDRYNREVKPLRDDAARADSERKSLLDSLREDYRRMDEDERQEADRAMSEREKDSRRHDPVRREYDDCVRSVRAYEAERREIALHNREVAEHVRRDMELPSNPRFNRAELGSIERCDERLSYREVMEAKRLGEDLHRDPAGACRVAREELDARDRYESYSHDRDDDYYDRGR